MGLHSLCVSSHLNVKGNPVNILHINQPHTRVDVPVFSLVSPRNGLCTTAYTGVIHSPAVHIFPVRRSNYTHVQLNSPAGIIGCKLNTQSTDTIYCIKQKFWQVEGVICSQAWSWNTIKKKNKREHYNCLLCPQLRMTRSN